MPHTERKEGKNDRQSHSGHSHNEPMKKDGHGKFNFGSFEDDIESAPQVTSTEAQKKVEVVSQEEFEKAKAL
ncbi:hypothetical protein HDU79_009527 [Rhizoclosmatium sp. JEL0117]|nr:hypothetical protein HDU79_009527 [Rhizoclosmatium sp. JEL0117]